MLFLRLGVDQNDIHKDYDKLIYIGLEHPMHKVHECRRRIRQSNWHNYKLEMSVSHPKRSLRDIGLPNPQLMVSRT